MGENARELGMRKLVTLSIGLTMALSVAAWASDAGWTPDAKDIAKLESVLDLRSAEHFEGPSPEALAKYARVYTGVMVHGHRMIRGVLLLGTPTGTSIVPEKDLPQISDGGCGIIYLLYDPGAARVISIICNGIA
jgi:hypothetical protein